MILERAIFSIKPGQAEEFEEAFRLARSLIQSSPGFRKLEMRRGIESPDSFLLLVWWENVEAHMVGFRESEAFKEWRALLGPHFTGPPMMEHYGAPL